MELANMGSEARTPMLSGGCDSEPTIEERLLRKKLSLERDLKDVNAALEALQANPEILKVMCLITKVRY